MAQELVSIKGNMQARPTWYLVNSTAQIVIHSDEFKKLQKAVNELQKSKAQRLIINISSVGSSDFILTLLQD